MNKIKKKLKTASLSELRDLQVWIEQRTETLWERREEERRKKAWAEVQASDGGRIKVRRQATLHVPCRPVDRPDAKLQYRILHFHTDETYRVKQIDEHVQQVWLLVDTELACLDPDDLGSIEPSG